MLPRLAEKCYVKNKLNSLGSIDVIAYLNLCRLLIERAVETRIWGDKDPFDIHGRQTSTEIRSV